MTDQGDVDIPDAGHEVQELRLHIAGMQYPIFTHVAKANITRTQTKTLQSLTWREYPDHRIPRLHLLAATSEIKAVHIRTVTLLDALRFYG